MKLTLCLVSLFSLTSAFLATERPCGVAPLMMSSRETGNPQDSAIGGDRKMFLQHFATSSLVVGAGLLSFDSPSFARGFATLDQAYTRYGPRIRAGGLFYQNDLRQLVAKGDFKGIQNALQEPPKRQRSDLSKPDAGVSERAKQAGGFSDARVLVAADLFAGSFSDNSISAKTKRMKEPVEKLREVVEEMNKTARIASGDEKVGGLFGIGGGKPSDADSIRKIRELYVAGGNAWNEFVLAANSELPGQFDKFEFIK